MDWSKYTIFYPNQQEIVVYNDGDGTKQKEIWSINSNGDVEGITRLNKDGSIQYHRIPKDNKQK